MSYEALLADNVRDHLAQDRDECGSLRWSEGGGLRLGQRELVDYALPERGVPADVLPTLAGVSLQP